MTVEEFRCHWTHPHGPHEWVPLLHEVDDERVLYLDPASTVRCPGKERPADETME